MQIKPISPKSDFVPGEESTKQHQAMIDSPAFRRAAVTTLAELARMNLSQDHMRGANLFLDTFQALAEKEGEQAPRFPHKSLSNP